MTNKKISLIITMGHLTEKQKQEYKLQIQKDYPRLNDFFIDIILNTYDADPDFVKNIEKHVRKQEAKRKDTPKEPKVFESVGISVVKRGMLPEIKPELIDIDKKLHLDFESGMITMT